MAAFNLFRRCKKRSSSSLLSVIENRQYLNSTPSTYAYHDRLIHHFVVPNHTEYVVETPSCYLRKFSPNGKHLIAFSYDQRNVLVYQFMGAGKANEFYSQLDRSEEEGGNEGCRKAANQLFNSLFKLTFSIPVADQDEIVHRECMLFAHDSHFLIVATYCVVTDYFSAEFYSMYRNNESMFQQQRGSLEDSTICLLDLRHGVVVDKHHFKKDKIVYLHNQGLSLYGNLLAVLSVQHQTIHLFNVSECGHLVPLREIGRFCLPRDEELFAEADMRQDATFGHSVTSRPSQPSFSNNRSAAQTPYYAFREKAYNSLKHRLLVKLFKEAERRVKAGDPNGMNWYFWHFSYFQNLRIWRMQLIDKEHCLLKYAGEDIVSHRVTDHLSHPSLFVIYRFLDAKILHVFESSDPNFLTFLELHLDHFRMVALNPEPLSSFSTSISNNMYAQEYHMRTKRIITNARNGGELEAVRRSLLILPLCSQCWSCSPYFDNSMFVFDEKWISPMERPKPCSDYSVRFHSRFTGAHSFSLNMVRKKPGSDTHLNHKPVAAFIFHPFEPFAISIQRNHSEFFVNFHVWLPPSTRSKVCSQPYTRP